ncbi:MAG: hypothetical protein CMM05_08950 [Rhodopirellula sp.]|nr:hypothetical protein [Rhodopirellula sp.]
MQRTTASKPQSANDSRHPQPAVIWIRKSRQLKMPSTVTRYQTTPTNPFSPHAPVAERREFGTQGFCT